MNIKKIITLGIFLILFTNCKKERDGFLLKGKIDGDYKGYIYLKYNNLMDSTLVSNNAFEFKGYVQHPTKALLFPGNPDLYDKMSIGLFMIENSLIETSLKYSEKISDNSLWKYLDMDTISGSNSQRIRKNFEDRLLKTVHNEKNDSIKKQSLFTNLHKFISDNPQSEMCGEYLSNLCSYYDYLNSNQMETLLNIMDTSYQNKNDINKISKLIKQRKLFALGNTPPKLILPNTESKLVNRMSFNGKIVLLEFWASWCLPCRQTNPELVKIYDNHKDKGFEILGISIDEHKTDWKLAIKEDKLIWPQVIDSLRTTEKTYKLNSIPFNLLLNRRGEIIAQNVKPVKLDGILNDEL